MTQTTKNPYYYMGVNPTVDLIVMTPEDMVLLVKRSSQSLACPGMWAFPGGFINTEAKAGELWQPGVESPEQAALREAEEETRISLENPLLIEVGIFEGNGRDPRDNEQSWSRSHAFVVRISQQVYDEQKEKLHACDDVEDHQWLHKDEVAQMTLAFDHNQIFTKALSKVAARPLKTK